MNPLDFIVLSHFSFRNIKYLSAIFLSSYDMSFLLCGISACRVCSCLISFMIALTPLLPYAVRPSFTLSCVSMICACVFGSMMCSSSDWASVNCFALGRRLYLAFLLVSVYSSSLTSDCLLLAFISDVIFISPIGVVFLFWCWLCVIVCSFWFCCHFICFVGIIHSYGDVILFIHCHFACFAHVHLPDHLLLWFPDTCHIQLFLCCICWQWT